MNELRPVWRCPCCNANVNCLQLRLDKKMKQILKDVDEKYFEAIIYQYGSWVPGQSSDEHKESTARCTASASGAESNQLSGTGVMPSENGIIDLSDDDEFNELVASVEKVVSPGGQPPKTATPNSSEGQEDRKPDIGGSCGSNLLHSSALFSASPRERLNSSAGYSSMNDILSQTGLLFNHSTGVPETNVGARHTQNPATSTHLWSVWKCNFAPSVSTVQQRGSRPSSLDRHTYAPGAASQSLPSVNQALAQRARVATLPQSVSGAAPNGASMTTTNQLQASHMPPLQLGSEQVFQHDMLHQQQSQDLLRQMQLSSNSFRAPFEMDGSQRSQRRGPRNAVGLQPGTVTNEQLARDFDMQQFGSAIPPLIEQFQHSQAYSHLGHNLNVSRQDYWQSQQVAQFQQAGSSNSNSGVAGGRSPVMSGVPFISPTTMATPGAQQVTTPRLNPRVVNTRDGNISTASVVRPSNTTALATPQVPNWRPTGRMRGSVSGGFLQQGNRVGVHAVAPQLGPVSRARVSAAPKTTSLPISNSMNLASPMSTGSLPTPLLVSNALSTGVRIGAYNASRLYSDDLSGPDAFLTSQMTSGGTLQDVVWLPTVGTDQVDNIGTQDVDRWLLDETLLTDISSQGF